MRSRKFVVVASFVSAWTFVSYMFLIRSNSDFPYNRSSIYKRLNTLEDGIKQDASIQDNISKNLVEIFKSKVHFPSTAETNETFKNFQLHKSGSSIYLPPAKKEIPVMTTDGQPVIPVLVLACNRVSITKCLDKLIEYRSNEQQFPIIVSQDCGDESTKNVILSYKDKLTLIEQPDLSDIYVPPKEKKFKGYYKISRHYGWALNTVFDKGFEYVIIVEDDLTIAPDFFEYFVASFPLLKKDPSIWCVSAWNDNGKLGLIEPSKTQLLYRTDFFPGLGWMLSKDLWNELSPKWPKSFWDDWIRHPEQRKNRVCIRPEISRTRTFGKVGVSNGLFFDKYLKYIKLSEEFVEFSKLNLSYLIKENYDKIFIKRVYDYPVITYEELRRNLISTDGPVRIQYNTKEQYKHTTKILGLMDDFKSGVPRTAYQGIVSFFFNGHRVYLAPNINWKGYDLSWS